MQYATISLSRQTLERLQNDYWTLNIEEAEAINETLKAMQINDDIEIVKNVFNPPGTFSHPSLNS